MKRCILLGVGLFLLSLATTPAVSGSMVLRETETGIYVEVTGEPSDLPSRLSDSEAQAEEPEAPAQPAPAVEVGEGDPAAPAAGQADAPVDIRTKPQEIRRKGRASKQYVPNAEAEE